MKKTCLFVFTLIVMISPHDGLSQGDTTKKAVAPRGEVQVVSGQSSLTLPSLEDRLLALAAGIFLVGGFGLILNALRKRADKRSQAYFDG